MTWRRCSAHAAASAESFEIRTGHDGRHHRRTDHVVGEPQAAGAAGPRMKQRIGVAVAGGERRRELPVRGPVPIRQRKVGLARQFPADALERADVGAVPRQEVPVCVRTEIAVDVGEAGPIARSGLRHRFIAATARRIAARSGSLADMPRIERRVTTAPCAPSGASTEQRKRRAAGHQKRASVEHAKPPSLMEKRHRMCAGKPIQRARMFFRVERLVSARG